MGASANRAAGGVFGMQTLGRRDGEVRRGSSLVEHQEEVEKWYEE